MAVLPTSIVTMLLWPFNGLPRTWASDPPALACRAYRRANELGDVISRPDEGPRVGIMLIEVSIDGGLKVDDGLEDAAPGESGEEVLDRVEPGARGTE